MNAFDEYANELSLLAGTANPLPALLSRHGPRRCDTARDQPWRRTYARFHPHEPSYCTFLYETQTESGALPLRASLYRDAATAPAGELVAGLGVVDIAPPTADDALDTLAAVMTRHADAAIVRWRPGHRCTFRAAHAHAPAKVHAQGTSRYVKVFASRAIAPHLHAGMQALWQHRGELGFAVAQPLEVDHDLRFASQAALPGTPLIDELLGTHGLEVAATIGHAAATLPPSPVATAAPADDDDTLARTQFYAHAISALLPEFADRVRSLVCRLDRLEATCAPARRLPIHGGLHASQWLRCGSALGLVDFDRLSVGDPELDVATFVTELRYERSAVVPASQLCRAFIEAYAERVPLDAQRLALYAAHKEVSKLMRLARQPRPDAPRRFARLLERLEQADQLGT